MNCCPTPALLTSAPTPASSAAASMMRMQSFSATGPSNSASPFVTPDNTTPANFGEWNSYSFFAVNDPNRIAVASLDLSFPDLYSTNTFSPCFPSDTVAGLASAKMRVFDPEWQQKVQ